MKAIILAGGAGDRLWPLSRKNAPKQFLNLNQDNSLFQETIIRNIPFCDEFVIVTNQEYQEIVEGQMNQFQGISYQIIVETEALGTAPAVLKASSVLSKEEMVLIMPADLVLIGEGYSDALYQAKTLAEQGQYVLFVFGRMHRKQVMAISGIREIMSAVLLKSHPRRLPNNYSIRMIFCGIVA